MFPVSKTAEAWRCPPTPSSAEVKEGVELYLYSIYIFVACPRVNFIFTFTFYPSNFPAPDNLNFISCSFLTPLSSGDYFITTINTAVTINVKVHVFLISIETNILNILHVKIIRFADINF